MKNERVGKGKDAEHVSVSAANDDRSPVLRRNSDRAQCSAVKCRNLWSKLNVESVLKLTVKDD